MSTIGVLNLIYSADTGPLTKGTGKARREVLGIGEVVSQTKSHIGGLMAGVGAALGIGSLGAWVKGSMDAINSTRVMAERIGTSSEALSRLSYAAKIADVDQETLNTSLQKMQRSLGEVATTGSGKAASALERLGLSAADLTKQDPAKSFEQIIGAMGGVSNPAERMKDAVDIFGRGASGILNLAVQGGDALAQMEAEADQLGISFTDLDAAKVDEADDAMTRIWETIGGVGRSLAVDLAPWITEVATRFTDWAKGGIDAGSMVTQSVDWVTNAMGYLGDVVQVAQTAFYGFRAVFTEGLSYIISGVDKMIQGFAWLYEHLTGTKLAVTDFFGEWSKGLESSAVKDLDKAGEIWGKDWAHSTVRAFTDEIKTGAQSRAVDAVEKAKKFRVRDTDEIERTAKASHAVKAIEFGSSEAANTILRTAFGGGGKDIAAVARNTQRTADGIDKLIGQLAQANGISPLDVIDSFS